MEFHVLCMDLDGVPNYLSKGQTWQECLDEIANLTGHSYTDKECEYGIEQGERIIYLLAAG